MDLETSREWRPLDRAEALAGLRASGAELDDLRGRAGAMRDAGKGLSLIHI